MKKSKLLLVIGILLTSIIFAQNEIRIGVNTGANLTKFRGNTLIENSDIKIGFLAGISFEYYLKENISLKINLNFERKSLSQKGGYFDENGFFTEMEADIHYDYLTLPVLLKHEFGNSNKFFVNGGPYFGLLLNAKIKGEGSQSDDLTSFYKKVDFGFSIGIGTKFHLDEKNDLSIEIRENYGLINISDVPVIDDGSIKTNSLNLILTWDFEI